MNTRPALILVVVLTLGASYVWLQLWLLGLLTTALGAPITGMSKVAYISVVTAVSVVPILIASWFLPKTWGVVLGSVAGAGIFAYLYVYVLGQNATGFRHGVFLLSWIMNDPPSVAIMSLRIGGPLAGVWALQIRRDRGSNAEARKAA